MKKCLVYETMNQLSELKIEESANDTVKLSGIFGVCGVKNENQRTYDKENYSKCVESLQNVIATEGCPGELEHPIGMNINLENVSHKIESIQMNEDGTVTGSISLLNTPKGNIAKAIVEAGLPLYISSRGMGTIDENGNVTLSSIKTYDLVGTPGFSQAKLNLTESQSFECLNESLCIVTEKEEDKDEEKPEDEKPEDEKTEEPKKDDEEEKKEEGSEDEEDKEKEKDESCDSDKEKETKENKNNSNIRNMKKTIISEIREALNNGAKSVEINLMETAGTMTVNAGTDQEGETAKALGHFYNDNTQPILDPLYPNSILNQLGVRTFSGLPMGDVVIPVLGKGTCGWSKSLAKAMKSENTITKVTLKPHRIGCYIDLDNKMLAQDNVQFEAAVVRDMQNAIYNEIEATLFGYAAAVVDEKPAGLCYDKTLVDATTYGKICDMEASVEDNNFNGNFKYVMSNTAKAAVRQMAKSAKSTELVYEGGSIDGTPVLTTSNVPAKTMLFGAWDNIAVGFWGNVNLTFDTTSQAVFDVTRVLITAYVDFQTIRDGGIVVATTDSNAVGSKLQ